eukprot:COSAG01_NODE_1945_length_8831_cov_4.250000_8_plen_57_part_00
MVQYLKSHEGTHQPEGYIFVALWILAVWYEGWEGFVHTWLGMFELCAKRAITLSDA